MRLTLPLSATLPQSVTEHRAPLKLGTVQPAIKVSLPVPLRGGGRWLEGVGRRLRLSEQQVYRRTSSEVPCFTCQVHSWFMQVSRILAETFKQKKKITPDSLIYSYQQSGPLCQSCVLYPRDNKSTYCIRFGSSSCLPTDFFKTWTLFPFFYIFLYSHLPCIATQHNYIFLKLRKLKVLRCSYIHLLSGSILFSFVCLFFLKEILVWYDILAISELQDYYFLFLS